ncbi:triose-phosphate isomerase [Thalassospira lucentensis]|jgi:triosephosphate isomerase|uniref:Triosephosphate isomerase n=2 Tax=Thalassospira TaxID=168934 RepID=A0A154KN68_9PROT|nr:MULTISPECIES: triose-phosphate isomerase [Thalassospira]KZB50937.1 triose-phosphate isomerase [Thalassospira xiamenensis]KZB67954.1 triose-phosphate isomerase [Thalassospira lucentensis]MCH2276804.1 triose-phosphate isomerase [Thalassospira sp.]RCK34381.1 triosephosphate isomerase [Thalassospira xiamenensis]RCK49663.1 triosephosphate isomerase [Thalassospira xiamenensis]
MSQRRPLIAGNWKMNCLRTDGLALARGLSDRAKAKGDLACDILVCPPATLISDVAGVTNGSAVKVGGQDCHVAVSGAHTGDIAAPMLADIGASYVLVGHSERRADHGESSTVIRQKTMAAHDAGLIAVVCVGETEQERDLGATLAVVNGQIAVSVPDDATPENTVIAYEPVWAIGTGRTASVDEVAEVHAAIRAELTARFDDGDKFRILYGGSVKPSNAAELLAVPDVDGALVGGASLKVDDFWQIIESCA